MRLFLVLLFLTRLAYGQASQDCVSKINSGFGPVASCTSEDSYHVVLQSKCNSAIDIVCGIQERSGEWKVFRKDVFMPADTLLAYGCDGSGKYQYWVRYTGDTSHLPTYEELNPAALKNASVDLFARLLYGDKEKQPLQNQKVDLLNAKGETIQTSVTDVKGNFVFHKVSNSERYEVFVGDVLIDPEEKLFLARQNGSILTELKLVKGRNYKYSFLPTDMIILSEMEISNPGLALSLFKKSSAQQFRFSQSIFYPSGSAKPSDLKELEVVLRFIFTEPSYDVDIISHTDSRGDDKENYKLSVLRSEFVKSYFVTKGINSARLNAIGMGEAQILNHCKNGQPCSEQEHKTNRRTEFLFKRTR